MITLICSMLVFELILLWDYCDRDGLEEFVEVFYGRIKEIIKGEI